MSKYMVLLYAAESAMPKPGSPEFDAQNAAYGAVFEDFSKRGAFVSGEPLTPSSAATSVRIRNGQRQDTPGSAANTPEQVIGYYVLECKDAGGRGRSCGVRARLRDVSQRSHFSW